MWFEEKMQGGEVPLIAGSWPLTLRHLRTIARMAPVLKSGSAAHRRMADKLAALAAAEARQVAPTLSWAEDTTHHMVGDDWAARAARCGIDTALFWAAYAIRVPMEPDMLPAPGELAWVI